MQKIFSALSISENVGLNRSTTSFYLNQGMKRRSIGQGQELPRLFFTC